MPSTLHVEPGAPLSVREVDCLQQLADGHSIVTIARDLHLSPHTVKTHLQRIYRKLGVADRAHAVAVAMRRGLIV